MEKLGIDPILIIVQIINFGLLLFLLKKVLYKPILTSIKNRQADLVQIEKDKNTLEKQKEEIEVERQKVLSLAQKEKREVVDAVKQEAEEERKKIIEKANKQAKEILKQTQKQLERDRIKLEKEIKDKTYKLAIEMVKKSLDEVMDKDKREKTVDIAIKKLSSYRE